MTPDLPPRFIALARLFQTMDQAWDQTAAQYEFQCSGCRDNCCFSLFYHHTHVEAAFLAHGFSLLPQEKQQSVLEKAGIYCDTTFSQNSAAQEAQSKKMACPLLENGMCSLYYFRPMICRMHGLPHELHKPGAPVFKGPGCPAGNFDTKPYIPFDRTPFYREMATIEMNFRQIENLQGRVKKTIAQILLTLEQG